MMKSVNNWCVAASLCLAAVFSPVTQAHDKPADSSRYISQTVNIFGAVEKPLVLTVQNLQEFPAAQVKELTISRQHGNQAGTPEKLKGIPLRDLLEKAVVISRDHNDVKKTIIIATATDDYKVVYSWSEIFNTAVGEGVLVFFEKDGKALPDEEGRIAMISGKDLRTGPRHVRWLKSIEVRKITD